MDFKNCAGNREFLYRISLKSAEKGNSAHKRINWHWEAVPKAVSNSQRFLPILKYEFMVFKANNRFSHLDIKYSKKEGFENLS